MRTRRKSCDLQVLGDRAQAVVAGEPAARLDLEFARRQVEFVLDDDDLLGRLDPVAADERARRPGRSRS